MTRFILLGDSAAYGVGDEMEGALPTGWGYRVASQLPEGSLYVNFSRPGATSREVIEVQLPAALEMEPDICGVFVGGNDLLRNGYSPEKLEANLRKIIVALLATGSEVFLIELHDPLQLLKLPRLLARVLRRRVESVNAVYRKMQRTYGIKLITVRDTPGLYNKKMWHIDRMHPSSHGHQLLAIKVVDYFNQIGFETKPISWVEYPIVRGKDEFNWLLKNGIKWFLKRSVDLFPAAIYLMGREGLSIVAKGIEAKLMHIDSDFSSHHSILDTEERRSHLSKIRAS